MNNNGNKKDTNQRLFLAIPVDNKIKDYLRETELANPHIQNARWTPDANLHFTVFYIGSIPEDNIGQLIKKLKTQVSETPMFSLFFDGIYPAPNKWQPKMIWAKFKKSKEFTQLTKNVYNTLKGFSDESSQFKEPIPHITLARFKKEVSSHAISINKPAIKNMVVQSCELWESHLSPNGATYETVEKFPLMEDMEIY